MDTIAHILEKSFLSNILLLANNKFLYHKFILMKISSHHWNGDPWTRKECKVKLDAVDYVISRSWRFQGSDFFTLGYEKN